MPGKYAKRWRELKDAVSILQIVLASEGSTLNRRGARLVGPCPIHRGDNPRAFVVDVQAGWWYCFTGCQRGGDSLALAWHLCDRSWPKTAAWLEQLANRPLVVPANLTPLANATSRLKPLRRLFRPFTRKLRLDPDHRFLADMNLKRSIIESFEAGAWHGTGYLEGTLAVRLHDLEGHPIGYAGRLLDPDRVRTEGKWRWPPGYPKSSLLFNWHRARGHLQAGIIAVEGIWSAMKLTQAGYPNVVVLGGTNVSRAQTELLAQASSLALMLDGDYAGKTASRRLVNQPIHPRQSVVRLPADSDPADLCEATLVRLLMAASFHPAASRD